MRPFQCTSRHKKIWIRVMHKRQRESERADKKRPCEREEQHKKLNGTEQQTTTTEKKTWSKQTTNLFIWDKHVHTHFFLE